MERQTSESVFLENLNEAQRRAVTHEGSPLLILAGAGSGKTRVITSKIAWLIAERGVPPESILAVTFTNKAAREMSGRAAALEPRAAGAVIRTFHSFGARFLRRYASAAGISPNFNIYDDDDSAALLRQAERGLSAQQVPAVIRKLDRAKNFGLSCDDPGLALFDPNPEFAELYRKYTRQLRDSGNVDFGDLICLPTRVLRENPLIRAEIHRRFRVILVDEYQDSNTAQFELLKELVGEETYLCVVGDDDQSIYSFRGAEVSNILSFPESFAGTEIIRLEQNYRSTPEILRVASEIVKNNRGRLGKEISATHGSGKKPVLVFLPDQEREAEFCAQLVQQAAARGCPYRDWAILYRTNAQSLAFETEFLRAKIPYTLVGSLKFYEREEVKNALALLSFVANRKDGVSLFRVLKKTVAGVGELTCRKIQDEFERLLAQYRATPDSAPLFEADASRPSGASSEEADSALSLCEPDFLLAAEHIALKLKKAGVALSIFVSAVREAVSLLGKPGEEGASPAEGEAAAGSAEDPEVAERPRSASDANGGGQSLSVFVFFLLEKSGLRAFYKAQDDAAGSTRALNLDELGNAAALFPASRQGLRDFLEQIRLDREAVEQEGDGGTDSAGRVTLITLHNTKGLEFERVVITGMESGLFPREDKTGEALEEERRLMYVGCTRAMKQLYFTSCAWRRMYGSHHPMTPSLFLFEMPPEDVKVLGTPPAAFSEYFGLDSGAEAQDADDGAEGGADGFSGGRGGRGGTGAGKASRTARGGNAGIPGSGDGEDDERSALARRWKKGVTVFHDDYGYGMITAAFFSGGDADADGSEFVVTVRFESGGEKQFMPQYQAHSLMIVKD